MSLAILPDSLVFEQTLLALSDLLRGDALREIDPIIDRFVLPLEAADPRKAIRFESLSACRHFDANHLILDGASHDAPPLRPMEFALEQLTASGASPAWRKTIARLGAHPRFDGSLQRPLLLREPGAEAGSKPRPMFAIDYLARASRAAPELAELSRQLEMRMAPSARQAAREWADPKPGAETVRAWVKASAPIALRQI